MASDNTKKIAVVITGENKTQQAFRGASQSLDGLKGKLQGMSATFTKMAAVGTAAFAGIAYGAKQAIDAAAEGQRAAQTFDALNKSIGAISSESIEKLRDSTRGMVADTDLMLAGNKFMAMGLATSQDEMQKLAQISTRLGTAMGNGATESMENFALMMANQSILRLDSFGISSGKVRERIEELMVSTEGMTREVAFNTAVMEQAEVTMTKLGDPIDTVADRMDRMKAGTENLKGVIGEALLPAVERLLIAVTPIIEKFSVWAAENPKLLGQIIIVAGALAGLVAVLGIIGLVLPTIITGVQLLALGFAFLLSPIGLIIAAIVAIVAVVIWFVANWSENLETIKWAWQNFLDFLAPMLAWFTNLFSSIGTAVVSAFTSMYTFVAGIFTKMGELISGVWNNIKEGAVIVAKAIASAFATYINGIISLFESMANGVISALNFLIRGMNKIQVSIPDWVPKIGGRTFGVNVEEIARVDIPRLAEGGIVTQSTLANIGEAGAEAVIPLDKLKNFGVGGGGVTININTMVGEREFAEKMGDRIIREYQLNTRFAN